MKKAVKITTVSLSALVLIAGVSAIGWHFYDPDPASLPVNQASGKYIYDVNNPCEAAGISDYVFVGTVNEITGYEYQGEDKMPYTVCAISVLQNLKGELPTDEPVILKKMGGLEWHKLSTVVLEDDILPEAGKTYIVLAGVDYEGLLHISSPKCMILLEDEAQIEEYKDAVENEVLDEYHEGIMADRNHTYGVAMDAGALTGTT